MLPLERTHSYPSAVPNRVGVCELNNALIILHFLKERASC